MTVAVMVTCYSVSPKVLDLETSVVVTVVMLQMVMGVEEYLMVQDQPDDLLPCWLAVCYGIPASTFHVVYFVSVMLPAVSEVQLVLLLLSVILPHRSLPAHCRSYAAVSAYCSKTS